MKRAGRKSLAQTPSPKEERIYGSKVNKEGSASSETEAKSISFSDKVMEILKKKQREYNKENPSTKVSIDVLKAVFRRGAGAYSRSHRPTITGGRPNSRTAWAIARVNKFLEKRSGKEVKKAYVQDDDLLKKYQSGGSTQPKDLTQIENYRNIYKGAEFYSFSDNPEKVEKSDRWFELFRTNQKERQLTAGEFSEFMELSSELSWEEFSEGGRVVIGKPKVFYTRTYADGTKQEFSVEDYEKNVLPYHLGGDMSKHLAPNGKPSNLNHKQWHLVRTPEFKAWFGDWENDPKNASKIVDPNGEPLVVYHGTKSEFSIFDLKKSGESNTSAKVGFWFTPLKLFAENFASDIWYGESDKLSVYSVFLNIKNPKIYETEIVSESVMDSLRKQLKDIQDKIEYVSSEWVTGNYDLGNRMAFDYSQREMINDTNISYYSNLTPKSKDAIKDGEIVRNLNNERKALVEKLNDFNFSDSYERFKTDIYKQEGRTSYDANVGGLGMALKNTFETISKYRNWLKEGGFDGIIIKNTKFDKRSAGSNNDQYVALYPEQIKLADGTNTTFDLENPDIRFAKGGMVEVVLNEGNGVAINKLYNEWENIRTEKQQIAWAKKVRETKFGSYGTIGILEVLDKFEFMQSNKVNGVMKHDFIEEVKDALNSYAEGGDVTTNLKELSNVEETANALNPIVNKWKSSIGVKLRNLIGLIAHNGDEVIRKFDPSKIVGQTRGRYGKGFYFSSSFKNFDYGDKSTYLDSTKLSLLNGDISVLQAFSKLRFPEEVDTTLYKLNELLSESKNIREYNEISEEIKRLEEYKISSDKNQIYIQKALEKAIKENPNQDFGSFLESLESRVIEANKLNTAKAVEGLNESFNNLLLQSGFDGISFTQGHEILIVPQEKLNDLIVQSQEKAISQSYHKAKSDGSNPELVKAVEEVLSNRLNTTFNVSNPDIRFDKGGSVEQTPKFGAVEKSKYKGWSEEKVMSYDFPELYEIAEKHHAGYKTIRKEFIKGIFVEREHTSDWGMSAHVSLQHVFENPQYYTILQSLGL